MALSHQGVYVQTPKFGSVVFTSADPASTPKVIATAGADGAKVVAIWATTNQAAATVVTLQHLRGAGPGTIVGNISVPANSGLDGSTPIGNLFGSVMMGLPLDGDGQRYLFLENGDLLRAYLVAALTGTYQLNVFCVYANF